ncbi:MAG: hypothetical protein LBG65_03840 [Puniceicoccales bacterium]|jgi:hypothetical protein|nr:hypothetical protein [Puniceicoccales bacterium]
MKKRTSILSGLAALFAATAFTPLFAAADKAAPDASSCCKAKSHCGPAPVSHCATAKPHCGPSAADKAAPDALS